jgi:PAS domain S-box-containing protein
MMDQDKKKKKIIKKPKRIHKDSSKKEKPVSNTVSIEETLRETEEKYHLLIENLPSVVWKSSQDGYTIFISSNIKDVYGYTPEEIYKAGSKLWLSRIHPEDINRVRESFNSLFSENKKFDVEYRIQRKDGRWIWLHDRAHVIQEKDGIFYAYGVFSDVTYWKRTEEAFKRSEIRFRSLVEQTTDSIFCYEYEPPIPLNLPTREQIERLYQGVLVECNDVCARSYGAEQAKDVIGKKLTDLFGTVPGSLDEMFKQFIENGYRTIDAEGVEVLDDGSKRYFLNNGHGVIEEEKLVRVWGTYRDITEQKKAELLLRHEKEFTETALNSQRDTFFVFNPATGKAIRWNKAFSLVSGYSDKEISQLKAPDSYYSPEDLEKASEATKQIVEGEQYVFEMSLITKSGDRISFEYSGNVVQGEKEGERYIVSIGRDITERKRAEKILQESEEKFRTVFELSPLSTVYSDLKGNVLMCNEQFVIMHATKGGPEAQVGRNVSDFFPEEEWPLLFSTIEKTIKEKKPQGPIEYTMLREDGTRFLVSTISTVIYDQEGNPAALLANAQDITERKRAEEALRESEERLKILFEFAPDAYYLNDFKGTFID